VNEVGDPAATVAETGTGLDCEETSKGVTDGSESIDLLPAANGDYISLRDAFDGTGYSNIYVEFDFYLTGGAVVNSPRLVFIPTDGAASPTQLWPRFALSSFVASADSAWLQCQTSAYATSELLPNRTSQYTVQIDINQSDSSLQTFRVYDDGVLAHTSSCSTNQANVIKGFQVGFVGGSEDNIDAQIDNLTISSQPIPAP
jgi:hypothetical protein